MTRELDGVDLAVLSNRFESVVRAMINTLFRTSRSGVLATARDLSCAIITKDCEFLAAAESLPIHVLGGDLAARALHELHPELRRGDAFLNNSPYHGNTHPADHSILVPVIDDEGTHHFTVFTKAHVADCGASRPTTYSSTARDVYDEGTLIFAHTRIQQDYRDCEDIIRMCRMRIRVPDDWRGDYLAQIGAARIGERLLLEMGGEYGWETLHAYARSWFDYSEQRMDEAVRELPSGRVIARTAHDPFPGIPDGIPLSVTVDVRPDEGLVEVDLRDNPDCMPCGFNMTEAYARGAALIAVFNSLSQPVPPNAGSFRRVRVLLRENCVAGIPRHPACCSSGMSPTDRVINAIARAIAELGEGVGMAEAGVNMPPAFGVLSGDDPRAGGTPFINQVILPAVTGGAGMPSGDGWLLNAVPVVSGAVLRDSVEMDERRHPIRIEDQRIIRDSEGAGRFRGAPGATVEYGPVGCSIDVMYTSDGTVTPALGVRGGEAGARATQYKRLVSGELVDASPERARLEPGETIISVSCGGGGYGPPLERDPERVLHDVVEGWISRERAQSVYGVVVTEAGEVDGAATGRLRAQAP